MKQVLIIKIGALGDLSFALPAAKGLKEALGCHITWVVGKSCQAFLAGHAHIDKLVTVDDKKLYSKNLLERATELAKLYFHLNQRFDYVIVLHRDPIYYKAFKLLARDAIFQLVREKNKNPRLIYIPPMTMHESLAIKRAIQAVVTYASPETGQIGWEWDYSHIQAVDLKLPANYAVLHLGGGSNTKTEFRLKCWPYWSELVLKLLAETNLNLVFVGAPSEELEYKKIKIQQTDRCVNLIGKTTLPQLTRVIQDCDLFVGVDSGPLHIADSMDKKAVGLFGPTSMVSWGLLSEKGKMLQHAVACSPCYQDDGVFPECGFEHRCMKLLDSDRVFKEIVSLTSI